jgi:hypothetical protein
MHSNEPLTAFLHKKYAQGTAEERRRPDFICGSDNARLVIVELKRPNETITVEHIDQLEDYLVTADDCPPVYGDKHGYLIGTSISPRLEKVLKNRRNIDFISYPGLVEGCNNRYREYLNAIEEATVVART